MKSKIQLNFYILSKKKKSNDRGGLASPSFHFVLPLLSAELIVRKNHNTIISIPHVHHGHPTNEHQILDLKKNWIQNDQFLRVVICDVAIIRKKIWKKNQIAQFGCKLFSDSFMVQKIPATLSIFLYYLKIIPIIKNSLWQRGTRFYQCNCWICCWRMRSSCDFNLSTFYVLFFWVFHMENSDSK